MGPVASSGELFYREQQGPENAEVKQPGEGVDYTAESPSHYRKGPVNNRTVPPGNPGFTRMPERDNMDPSSAKVIPDQMQENIRDNLTYQASAKRVAARFAASYDPESWYYDIEPGTPLQTIIDRWQKQRPGLDQRGSPLPRQKAYDRSMPIMLTVKELWPLREYTWTRDIARGGFAKVKGESVVLPGPLKWDAIKEDMAQRGWDPKSPLKLEIGAKGGVKVGEGNHRLAIARELGISRVPVWFQFMSGSVRKNPQKRTELEPSPKAVEKVVKNPPRDLSPEEEKQVDKIMELLGWNPRRASSVRVAARISDILGNTGPHIFQRAGKVSIKPRRFDPTRGFWTFVATGSKGERYMVRVKGIRKGNVRQLNRAQVKLSCTCPFWRWQGPEHWAKQNNYLYGRPRGTASKPVVMDPKEKHWGCKHMIAALQIAQTYRFGSIASGWTFRGELVPMLDPARVAQRFASRVMVLRPEGWEALGREAYREMESWVSPNVVWRGMDEQEYRATLGAGKPIKSRGDWSHPSEGTNFAKDPRDAESYVNFGRTDPRVTGKPNYLVGVRFIDSMRKWSDGYIKTPEPVPPTEVTEIWEMSSEDGAVVAKKLK